MNTENIKIAFRYVKGSLLRSVLTILIIVIGITALVGMLSAVDGIRNSILQNFSVLGSNILTIQNRDFLSVSFGRGEKMPSITYRQAEEFKQKYEFPAIVSINYVPVSTATVKYLSRKTNPRIRIIGADDNYFFLSSMKIEKGRNFNSVETQFGASVAIIGQSLKKDLFDDEEALNKIITAGSNKLKVIGVLEKQGNSFGGSSDDALIIPIIAGRKAIPVNDASYKISIYVDKIENIDAAKQAAIAVFRMVRKLRPRDDNNFTISKSDSLVNLIADQMSTITVISLVISIVTLIGSSIALMNIMLVSVKERTREIGTLKALGATLKSIRNQFLAEALLVSQIGGVVGIIFGVGIGYVVSSNMESTFIVPWNWIIIAYLVSILVGVVAGYYPAVKASRLDPIEALRYE